MWPFNTQRKYLSALLIVVEDEPPGGSTDLAERLLDKPSGRSARHWRRHWTDDETKSAVVLNTRCGSFTPYDVAAFALVQFRLLWGIDATRGLDWGPFAIGGVRGWVFDLWSRKRPCTSPILACRECQQSWDLTSNARFVTDEDVEEMFVAYGVRAIVHMREPTAEQPVPRDLVFPVTSDTDDFRKELERVLRDLRRGRPRRWVCQRGHEHGYPSSFFRHRFVRRTKKSTPAERRPGEGRWTSPPAAASEDTRHLPDVPEINTTCPHCYRRVLWVPTLAGREVNCYSCGRAFTMPTKS